MFGHRLRLLVGLMALGAIALAAHPAAAEEGTYRQTNLVSDIPGLAAMTDPDLVNPWGISFGPTTFFWVSDNGVGKTTLYNGAGVKQALIVTIPPPAGSPPDATSAPTGQVFNGTSGFVVTSGGKSGPARFLFATEDGTISGWNPGVDATHAILAVDRSGMGAVYKGLTLAMTPAGPRLFAANFNAGTVEVYDAAFNMIATWADPHAPVGFAPFNVQAVSDKVVVTYAKQDADGHDDVAGPGNGLIDVLDPSSLVSMRLATGRAAGGRLRPLNSPWGVALAPASFGRFGGALLVGNFGDGRINAFSLRDGRFMGQLKDGEDHPLSIDGLWALAFGNGGNAGRADTLYFTAGPDGEQHGLFGSLMPVPDEDEEHEGHDHEHSHSRKDGRR